MEVTSASFPLFSRNLNTGGHNEVETEYVPAGNYKLQEILRAAACPEIGQNLRGFSRTFGDCAWNTLLKPVITFWQVDWFAER